MQLGHWVNVGAIIPLKDDPRRGGVRVFSQQNLIEAMICRELNYFRMEARSIAGPLGCLRDRQFWGRLAEDPGYLEDKIFVFVRAETLKEALQRNPKRKRKARKRKTTEPVSELDEEFPVVGGVEAVEKVLKNMPPEELRREIFGIISLWKDLPRLLDFLPSSMIIDVKKFVEEAGGF